MMNVTVNTVNMVYLTADGKYDGGKPGSIFANPMTIEELLLKLHLRESGDWGRIS